MTGRRRRQSRAIWLLAGGAMQELAARRIVERGYRLILSDRDPDCVCAGYATAFVPLDTFDIPGHLEQADRLRRAFAIQAVLTVAADCHETVAHLAKALKLPGVDPRIARICRYKGLTRRALARAGLPQPRYVVARSPEEARRFLQTAGGPVVLKATNNSGSRGLAVLEHPDQPLDDLFLRAREAGTTGRVVVEERLAPVESEIAEQSVETIWYQGRMYWLNWVDRLFRQDFLRFAELDGGRYEMLGWGVELGHINPAVHRYEVRRAVEDQVRRAGQALGMQRQRGGHVLKADVMLTAQGPCILEVTPRLSGGWDSSASTPARGADFIGGAIELALGTALDLPLWHQYFAYRDPALYAAVLAAVPPGATDCIGRQFAMGTDYQPSGAVRRAIEHLNQHTYVI